MLGECLRSRHATYRKAIQGCASPSDRGMKRRSGVHVGPEKARSLSASFVARRVAVEFRAAYRRRNSVFRERNGDFRLRRVGERKIGNEAGRREREGGMGLARRGGCPAKNGTESRACRQRRARLGHDFDTTELARHSDAATSAPSTNGLQARVELCGDRHPARAVPTPPLGEHKIADRARAGAPNETVGNLRPRIRPLI